MSSHNASSVDKSQQWRNELQMKPADPAPMPSREIFKEPAEPKYLTPIVANSTICCDKENCDRARIEIMPEQYFKEPDYIYVSAAPFVLNPEGRPNPQSGNNDPSAPQAEPYMEPLCSFCGLNRGQLVTICCVGRDCDNSTKIDEHMGPPQEKRAKTSYDQYKY